MPKKVCRIKFPAELEEAQEHRKGARVGSEFPWFIYITIQRCFRSFVGSGNNLEAKDFSVSDRVFAKYNLIGFEPNILEWIISF